MEGEKMDRKWMPTTSGVINIILGAIALIIAIFAFVIGAAGAAALMGFARLEVPAWIVGALFSGFGVIYLIFGVLAVVGGYYALKRKLWGMALTGSILGVFIIWPLAAASIVFIILSHKEFK